MYIFQEIYSKYICGGTLISRNHILTAAHCVTKPHTTNPHKTEELGVYLGKTDLRKIDEGTQFRTVSNIFVHPEFNVEYYLNDIAILKLSAPVKLTKYVRQCCLWEGDTDLGLIVGQIGKIYNMVLLPN